ncbi:MAG TPA: NAD(P)H-hydrate dehydratase [Chitinophagaceae bacterium]|nr:NAD(P)H-hydrate dehydratase [Chitinophagaceae bacterium]
MKIFSASQIREWDEFTINKEPISSIALMERAAVACTNWIAHKFKSNNLIKIFCGRGNNGADGLAVGRMLIEKKFPVEVFIVGKSAEGSDNFKINLGRLKKISNEIYFLDSQQSLPGINKTNIVIDALFGTGLNKKPSGIYSNIIRHINDSGATTISIDMPSGLYTDTNSTSNTIVCASCTLSFQQVKLSFLMAENESYTGEVVLLNIGLADDFYKKENSNFFLVDKDLIKRIYLPRKEFANKGNFGYACLVAGSYGMMGAAVLSSRACLRSGVGKITCYICKDGYTVMQTSVPEAMCKIFGKTFIKEIKDLEDFNVVGIGPGIGKHASHKKLLQTVFTNFKKPVVIDADGSNCLSAYKSLYKSIPANSIITPHPKEFERMFGKTNNDFERMKLAIAKAKELNIFIVLKGHHTLIATPDGKSYFNPTGNAGMATAGSGDVLTGIITSLLAQRYSPLNSCILGVYLHGLAGDFAAKKLSKEAMIAGDIIDFLSQGFLSIENFQPKD